MWIILPIKNLDQAKQRLSGALSGDERRALFEVMLRDVLTALRDVQSAAGVLIVSREARARELAAEFGADLLVEADNIGQSAAVQRGVDWVQARGGRGVVTVPGDTPALTAAELDELIALNGTDARALTLSPSHDRRGTNCIVASPPDLIPFHFGHQSFQPHLAEAEAIGITPKIRPLPGVGLDIDTPEDALKFLDMGTDTGTHRFMEDHGIAARLRAHEAREGSA